MRDRRAVGAALVGAGLILSGCASTEAGMPTAGGDAGRASTPSTAGPSAEQLAAIDPCTLLADTEARQLGVPPPGVRNDMAGASVCGWQLPVRDDPQFDTGLLVGVAIDPETGVDELAVPPDAVVTPTTVGEHRGRVVAGDNFGSGSCSVELRLGPNAAALVDVLAGQDTERACEVATRAATLVEPKLP